MQRVQKILSNYGYCSRRQAEKIIEQGRVMVNGKPISLGDKASEKDSITVDFEEVHAPRKVYLLFHKPRGCVTAVTDRHEKTVLDYINIQERVFPIGRLDKDTSGLLLLTNDGDFSNKVMHPRYTVFKTYELELERRISRRDLESLTMGVTVEGRVVKVKHLQLRGRKIILTIHEGRNRIVRRLMKELGYSVTMLARIRIGTLSLGALKPGKYIFLRPEELKRVFDT